MNASHLKRGILMSSRVTFRSPCTVPFNGVCLFACRRNYYVGPHLGFVGDTAAASAAYGTVDNQLLRLPTKVNLPSLTKAKYLPCHLPAVSVLVKYRLPPTEEKNFP